MSEPLPTLNDPVALAAFEGWNDAADAASGALVHLEAAWHARPLVALDPDDYYDFQVNRPTVTLVDGDRRRIEWPTSRLSVATPPGAARDVVLLRGLEPNMRWRDFCQELIAVLRELGVHTVVALGALLADTPHTRPVPVTGTTSDEATGERLGLARSRYEGPTGILGVFQEACADAGLTAMSLWAAVPHYVAQAPCPKATLALLRRVEDVLDLPLDYGDLEEQARTWERTVNELAGADSDIAEYVTSLESRESPVDLPEASGEAIARDFERFLRRRGQG